MRQLFREKGQGLVEYALILVLVAVLVIAILLVMGPSIGNIFTSVTEVLQDATGAGGAISSVSTSWSGPNVKVSVTVSEPNTTVSASITGGSGGGPFPASQSCSPGSPCVFTVTGASANGKVRVSGGGGQKTASW